MRRGFLLFVVAVLFAAPAHAARVWTDLQPLTSAPYSTSRAVAAGNQTLLAWVAPGADGADLTVRLGDHPAQDIGTVGGGFAVAGSSSGSAAVAYTTTTTGTQQTMVAPIAADGTVGTPVDAGGGYPSSLTMNATGDALLVLNRYPYEVVRERSARVVIQSPDSFTTFRPAGGTWGAPVKLPALPFAGPVLTSDGTAIFPVSGQAGTDAVMRKRDGSLSDTVHVLPDVFAAALAADGQGHAIAVGAGTSGADLRIAVFTGGAWEPATDHALSPPLQGAPSVTADDAGDAVIAWRDVDTSRYTYGAGAVRVMTGSLADGTFGAPAAVDDVLSPSGNATVAMASDGSTVIAYGDAPHQAVRVVRRDGIGPFGTPQVAACVDNFYTPDGFALDNSGRATLLAGGETHDAPATAASDKTCHVPETGSTGPRPSFSPNPVIAGEPVHIDDSGIRRPDWDIGRCGFDMDADGVQETTRDGPMLDWTFATPGRHPFLLQCQETSRGGDGTVAPYDTFVVDVFARPTLAVPTRVAHHEAVHRGVPLEANAFTGSESAFVTLTVRADGDVLGRVRRRLGTTPRTLRVPLNAAGRRAARHGVRARVVMRQAGTIEALQHVRIR